MAGKPVQVKKEFNLQSAENSKQTSNLSVDGNAVRVKKEFKLESAEKSPKTRFITKVNPKYYKQAYRTEWESMPDFKGWLKGVSGEPTRAYCTLCKKSLHAHRLSLLKHTCTLKHTKAAQKDFALKTNKQETEENEKGNMEESGTSDEIITQPRITEVEIVEDIVIANSRSDDDVANKETDSETPPVTEEPEHTPSVPKKRLSRLEMAAPQSHTGPLSTHVLDTAKGNPVSGLQVSLYKLIDGRWTHISEGITNPDGRFTNFIQKADFTAGRYKLHFDVDRYFELRKLESLYPFIEIVFDVKSPQEHYHVPLLLSPFGYTTYRGS